MVGYDGMINKKECKVVEIPYLGTVQRNHPNLVLS